MSIPCIGTTDWPMLQFTIFSRHTNHDTLLPFQKNSTNDWIKTGNKDDIYRSVFFMLSFFLAFSLVFSPPSLLFSSLCAVGQLYTHEFKGGCTPSWTRSGPAAHTTCAGSTFTSSRRRHSTCADCALTLPVSSQSHCSVSLCFLG